MVRIIRASLIGVLCAISLLLAACNTITTQLTPGSMKVSIDIKDYHQGSTQVFIRFADKNNNTVEFVHGETVKCNGVFLAYDSGFVAHALGYGAYMGNVPLQPASGQYAFTFTPAGGGMAQTMTVHVVNAPIVITQPASGATVAIPTTSATFTVTYPPSGLPNTGIFGLVNDSRAHSASALTLNEPGSLNFKGSDLQQFQPGAGAVSLSRGTNQTLAGTAFIAVSVDYENISTIPITWQ
jgi:hypothetical protein